MYIRVHRKKALRLLRIKPIADVGQFAPNDLRARERAFQLYRATSRMSKRPTPWDQLRAR